MRLLSNSFLKERINSLTVAVLAVFFFSGLALCTYSFENTVLVHPKINFAGLIIMLILPASTAIVLVLCCQIAQKGPWAYRKEMWE